MLTYCITTGRQNTDLSGMNKSLSGGRWNHKGTPALYTSTSRSLALLEFLLGRPSISENPGDVYTVTIEIPDIASMTLVSVMDLPGHWQNEPPPAQLADIGTRWAKSRSTLLLHVPSTMIPQEFNVLVNPEHPQMVEVSVVDSEAVSHIGRLLYLQ